MRLVDPGLQSLFMLLRQAGIPVGLEELRRLGTVFAAAPALDENGLRQVIESVCVKSVEQQKIFRRVYDKWLAVAEKQLAVAESRSRTQHEGSRHKKAYKESALLGAQATPAEAAPTGATEAMTEATIDAMPAVEAMAEQEGAPARSSAKAEVPDLEAFRQGLRFPVTPQATGEADKALPRQPEVIQAQATISPGPVPAKRPRLPMILAVVATLALVAMAVKYVAPDPWDPGKTAMRDAGSIGEQPAVMTSDTRGTLPAHRPVLEVVRRPGPPVNLLGYVAVGAALGMGLWLLLARGRGRWLPSVPRAQAVPGAVALARGGVRSPGGALFLDAQDEETLVWGVGRFVSDELSQALDIGRTVHETAAAYGRPVLRYEAARFNREVWLWVDESMDSPVARHLARDLAQTLRSSGLPVTVSMFWGIPSQLRSESESVVTLDEIESQRESAAVAILTDGRLMHAAHRALDRAPALHELLRDLSFWPRVTFIDFGRGRLGPIVESHGLRVIAPQDAPAALSDLAEGSDRPEYSRLVGDARVWAAACALSSRPVDDPTALKLRQMLGLSVSPWAIETLRENADHRAGGLSWSCRGRADLIAWLLDAEELPERGLPPPDSLLARIVAAWDRLLVERERAQRAGNPGWEGSAEQDALRVERAFVHIWDRPDEAASTLYELFHGPQQASIRHGLGELAPRECADHVDSIPLPWALRLQRRETQVMLTEMGLGAKAQLEGRRSLPRPGRLLLALGLCGGVVVGGSAALIEERVHRERPEPAVENQWPPDTKPVFLERVPVDAGRWEVRVHTPWFPVAVVKLLMEGQDVRLRAMPQPLDCVEEGPGGRLLRCCQSEEHPVPQPRFTDRWSFAVLPMLEEEEDYLNKREYLANRLLCSGTADAVYLAASPQALPDWSTWGGSDPARSQLLVISDEVPETLAHYTGQAVVIPIRQWNALLDATDFEGDPQTLLDRVPQLDPVVGDAATFLVQGMGACGKLDEPCCWPDDDLDYCEPELRCHQGKCATKPVCEPGTARCEGHLLLTCNAEGTDETVTACGPDTECQGDRCVSIEKPCQPGQSSCSADGTEVMSCEDESRRRVRERCAPGSLCRAGACYDIESAAVTFELAMESGGPGPAGPAKLWCAVGGESIAWQLDPQPDLRPVSRTITVPFMPQRPGAPLEIACWLQPSRKRADAQSRSHAWTRASEGKHVFQMRGMSGLRVVYTIRVHLAGPDRERASDRRPQPRRPRPARDGARDDGPVYENTPADEERPRPSSTDAPADEPAQEGQSAPPSQRTDPAP